VKEYGPGDAFGELGLLYNAPRAATITAKSEVSLWALDSNTFQQMVKNAILYLNSYIHRTKRSRYQEFIKSVPVFKALCEYELFSIMDAVAPVEFKVEDTIITEVFFSLIFN